MAVRRKQGSLPELAVVFGFTVALPLLFRIFKGPFFNTDLGQARLLTTLVMEGVAAVLLWPWLVSRGWSFRAIAGAPEPKDVWRGVLLYVLCYAAFYISWYTWFVFVPGTYEVLQHATQTGRAAPWVVVLGSVVNPVFEEFLWLAYGMTALRRYGDRTALVGSLALRMSVHLYQGRMAFIGVLPGTLIFTIYYLRTGRLWTIVASHMIWDALAFLSVVRH